MNGRHFSFGKPGNPLAQFLSLLVFGVVLVGAVHHGRVRAHGAARPGGHRLPRVHGPRLVGCDAIRAAAGRTAGQGPPGPAKGIRYIDGEYEVIDADADAERRRSGEGR